MTGRASGLQDCPQCFSFRRGVGRDPVRQTANPSYPPGKWPSKRRWLFDPETGDPQAEIHNVRNSGKAPSSLQRENVFYCDRDSPLGNLTEYFLFQRVELQAVISKFICNLGSRPTVELDREKSQTNQPPNPGQA